jgi:sulfopropanediol 3-dehydrogenase
MIRRIKTGLSAETKAENTLQVRNTVEGILGDIAARGGAAVREFSQKFDQWSPPTFRLTADEIADCVREFAEVHHRGHSIRADANQALRAGAEGLSQGPRGRDPAGRGAGPPEYSVNSVGCYIPGGRYPMVASAHMSVVTAKAAGVKRIIACAPPFGGKPHPAIVAAMHSGRRG